MRRALACCLILAALACPSPGRAWHDETHLAIARAAGYEKWYNAAGADMAKLKAGGTEKRNHFAGNPPEAVVTPEAVLRQAELYDNWLDLKGHLYGAIVASIRQYRKTDMKGKYAEYHLAFCAHYVGDLSQPLHNTRYGAYNRRSHTATDAVIEAEALENVSRIEVYPIDIRNEEDLAREIARIANLSLTLGYRLEEEERLLTREEAYRQVGHSASLLKGILKWVGKPAAPAAGCDL